MLLKLLTDEICHVSADYGKMLRGEVAVILVAGGGAVLREGEQIINGNA